MREEELPGIRAFSLRMIRAIEALDAELARENVTEAANACRRLMDEAANVHEHLAKLT